MPPEGPSYEDVLIWYDDLTAAVDAQLRTIDWPRVAEGLKAPQITSRAKTVDTLRDKLQRTPSISMGYVQDVAGVRIEAEMSMATQDAVANAVALTFGHDNSSIKDLRVEAHSGYRAVHIWLRFPAGRVEVQVRTRLQGRWANAFEALADLVGRTVRYGELPTGVEERGLVVGLIDLSTVRLAELEGEGNTLAATQSRLDDLRERLVTGLIPKDEAYAARVDEFETELSGLRHHYEMRAQAYHDLLVDLEEKFLSLRRGE